MNFGHSLYAGFLPSSKVHDEMVSLRGQPSLLHFVTSNAHSAATALLQCLDPEALLRVSVVDRRIRRAVLRLYPYHQLHSRVNAPFHEVSRMSPSFHVDMSQLDAFVEWVVAHRVSCARLRVSAVAAGVAAHLSRLPSPPHALHLCSDGVASARLDMLGDGGFAPPRTLRLAGFVAVTWTGPAATFDRLRTLHLSGCPRLRYLGDLHLCRQLRTLVLARCTSVTHLDSLPPCPSLRRLDCAGCTALESVAGSLPQCTSLTVLNLSGCRSLRGLEGLEQSVSLRLLDLSNCISIQRVDGLRGCSALRSLRLAGCTRLMCVEALATCVSLRLLSLTFCTALTRLPDLDTCSQLRHVSTVGCPLTGVEGALTTQALRHIPSRSFPFTALAH